MLLEAYILRTLTQRISSRAYRNRKPPNRQQTLKWLANLALQLQQESKTEFLLEEMQPTWLLISRKGWIYAFILSIYSAIISGFISGVLGTLFISKTFNLNIKIIEGLILGAFVGFVISIFIFIFEFSSINGESTESISPKLIEISREYFKGKLLSISGFSICFISLFNFRNGINISYSLIGFPIIFVLAFSISSVMDAKKNSRISSYPNQKIIISASQATLSGIIIFWLSLAMEVLILCSCLFKGMPFSDPVIIVAISISLIFCNEIGYCCIKHLVLRFVLFSDGKTPWNYAQFLDYCTERLILQRVGGKYRFVHDLLMQSFLKSSTHIKPTYNTKYLLRKSQVLLAANKNHEAIQGFSSILDMEPMCKSAIIARGKAFQALNSYESAISDFTKYIELDVKNFNAYYYRGLCYRATKKYEDALKDFNYSLKIKPRSCIASRGQTYFLMSRYEDALKDFNQAIKSNKNYYWAIAGRGQTYYALKCYEDAVKDFDRAIELEPTTAWSFIYRAQIYQQLKRYEEALKDVDRAIELEPTNWKFSQRGQTYQALKRYEEALKDFDSSIELAPDSYGRGYYLRSLTLIKLDRPTEAQTDLQTAIVLAQTKQAQDPIDWQNNFNLALYYLAAGQIEESHGLYDRAYEASREMIEMAIQDLDDYLTLFPDRLQVLEVRDRLSSLV